MDVGHNPEAVTTLVEHLRTSHPGRRVHAIFAMMKDKDVASVLKIMAPAIHAWYFVQLSNPRAITKEAIQDFFAQCQITNVSFDYTAFVGAFAAAKKQCQPGDLLLVFGSFFLVSECLIEFEGR